MGQIFSSLLSCWVQLSVFSLAYAGVIIAVSQLHLCFKMKTLCVIFLEFYRSCSAECNQKSENIDILKSANTNSLQSIFKMLYRNII